jgi:hypothetical protein
MKKIIRLTESDLTKIVRRVIKEQTNDNAWGEQMVMLRNESADVVSDYLSNINGNTKFIAIINCEYADFSDIDICGYNRLMFINVAGTDNNLDEQGYDCVNLITGGMYEIMDENGM